MLTHTDLWPSRTIRRPEIPTHKNYKHCSIPVPCVKAMISQTDREIYAAVDPYISTLRAAVNNWRLSAKMMVKKHIRMSRVLLLVTKYNVTIAPISRKAAISMLRIETARSIFFDDTTIMLSSSEKSCSDLEQLHG